MGAYSIPSGLSVISVLSDPPGGDVGLMSPLIQQDQSDNSSTVVQSNFQPIFKRSEHMDKGPPAFPLAATSTSALGSDTLGIKVFAFQIKKFTMSEGCTMDSLGA